MQYVFVLSLTALAMVDLSTANKEEDGMEDWTGGCGLRLYNDPLVAAPVKPPPIEPLPYPLVSLAKQVETTAAKCSKHILRDICVRNCLRNIELV